LHLKYDYTDDALTDVVGIFFDLFYSIDLYLDEFNSLSCIDFSKQLNTCKLDSFLKKELCDNTNQYTVIDGNSFVLF